MRRFSAFNILHFNYLVIPNYINFFLLNNVDVPVVFNKSFSLKRTTTKLFFVKFINLIMRRGLFIRSQRLFFTALISLFTWIRDSFLSTKGNVFSLTRLSVLFNFCIIVNLTSTYKYFLYKQLQINFLHTFLENEIILNPSYFMKQMLINKVNTVRPLFLFAVYKINKFIRKYSRGKSGKYTLIWKYIPMYKRQFVTLRWLIKDLKFNSQNVLEKRIVDVLKNFFFFPQHSYVNKSKAFIHNYIFKNYKKTLLLTLSSTN